MRLFGSVTLNKVLMAIQKYFDRIRQMDQLIRLKSTGNPKQFAYKLGVSERTLYDYLNIMKREGAQIEYSNSSESYYYEIEGKFIVGYLKKLIDK